MKSHNYLALVFFVIAFFAVSTSVVADEAAERVFCNGRIFTAEPERPYADAVAIRNGKIVAVGNCEEVKKVAGNKAELVDLHGQTLLPGFIDSHSHSVSGGISLISADVSDKVRSMEDLVAFVADARKTGKGMRGDILSITGMPLAFWSKTHELSARFSSG